SMWVHRVSSGDCAGDNCHTSRRSFVLGTRANHRGGNYDIFCLSYGNEDSDRRGAHHLLPPRDRSDGSLGPSPLGDAATAASLSRYHDSWNRNISHLRPHRLPAGGLLPWAPIP